MKVNLIRPREKYERANIGEEKKLKIRVVERSVLYFHCKYPSVRDVRGGRKTYSGRDRLLSRGARRRRRRSRKREFLDFYRSSELFRRRSIIGTGSGAKPLVQFLFRGGEIVLYLAMTGPSVNNVFD